MIKPQRRQIPFDRSICLLMNTDHSNEMDKDSSGSSSRETFEFLSTASQYRWKITLETIQVLSRHQFCFADLEWAEIGWWRSKMIVWRRLRGKSISSSLRIIEKRNERTSFDENRGLDVLVLSFVDELIEQIDRFTCLRLDHRQIYKCLFEDASTNICRH